MRRATSDATDRLTGGFRDATERSRDRTLDCEAFASRVRPVSNVPMDEPTVDPDSEPGSETVAADDR
jgi:hypothetical protein